MFFFLIFFFQAEDGIRDLVRSRGLGDVYKRQHHTCVEKRGKVIIPAFSLGRTQEIVYLLDQIEKAGNLPDIPVYVDSPLAVNATEVFLSLIHI